MSRRIAILAALVSLPALVVGVWIWHSSEQLRQLDRLPSPDLAAVHSEVRQAIHDASDRVRDNPQQAETWGGLGMVYMAHDFPIEALACFQEAGRRADRDFRWPYLSGIAWEQADLERANQEYQAAEALRADYIPLQLRLIDAALRLGNFDAADRQLKTATALFPDEPVFAERAGWRYDLLGEPAPARRAYERAVALGNRDRGLRRKLVRICRQQGDGARASHWDAEALLLTDAPDGVDDPILREVQRNEASARRPAVAADALLAQEQWTSAAQAYDALIARHPELTRPRINRANLALRQGRVEEAEARFREILKEFPDDVLALQGLAYALAAEGRRAEAREALRGCLRLKPDFSEAHLMMGALAEQSGDPGGAIAAYRAALAASPGLAHAHAALGRLLVASSEPGEVAEGMQHLEAAARLAPEDAAIRQQLEQARMGQPVEVPAPASGGSPM